LVVSFLLILTKPWHGRFSMDELVGIQKMHVYDTPRIGGVAIVLGVLAGYLVAVPERQFILGNLCWLDYRHLCLDWQKI